MNYLKYEDAVHQGYSARYDIDWDNGERKFKSPMSFVRSYENGPTQIHFHGQRSPDWRIHARKIGVDMRMLSGLIDYTLHDPDTGEKVKKNSIKTRMFCLSKKWGRVYPAENGVDMSIVSEHAQPTSVARIKYTTPNKERYAQLLDRIQPHFDLGLVLVSLTNNASTSDYVNWNTKKMLTGEDPIPEDLTTVEARAFCISIQRAKVRVLQVIDAASRNVFEVPYLTIKE